MKKCMIFILLIMAAMVSLGEKVATIPNLLKPSWLIMDDHQIYVCDRGQVKIFSRTDFSMKAKFGSEGEGPQEFKLDANKEGLIAIPEKDYVLVTSLGKASFYSKDGKFIKEIRTEDVTIPANYQAIGDKFAGVGSSLGSDLTMNTTINILDTNFKKVKVLFKQALMKQGSMTFPMVYPAFVVDKNKIVVPGGEDFSINIFDADGNKVTAIKREYKRLKVTDEYKKGVHQFFKTNPGTKAMYESFFKDRLKFVDLYTAIQFFNVDDGKIYVQTYLKKDGKHEYFIYDIDGKFLKRLFLPVGYMNVFVPYPMTIKNNVLYQLIENEEEEEWELHKVDIK